MTSTWVLALDSSHDAAGGVVLALPALADSPSGYAVVICQFGLRYPG